MDFETRMARTGKRIISVAGRVLGGAGLLFAGASLLSLVVEVIGWLTGGDQITWLADWNNPGEFGAFGVLVGVPAFFVGWALQAAIGE